MAGRLQLDCPMSEYERTLSVEAPAPAVFEYVSTIGNVPNYLAAIPGANDTPKEFSEVDAEDHRVEWSTESYSGSLQIDSGDVAASLCEITLALYFPGQEPSDTPTAHDEQVLDALDKTLTNIRQHVEHAHRTRKANFM